MEELLSPKTLPLLIPIVALMIPVVGILVGGIVGVTKMVIRHRERMEMIRHGLNPDQLADDDEDDSPA